MTKREFLDALAKGLKGLPQSDIDEHLAFYSEMIDDRLEEGVSEEAAVAELGDPETLAAEIMAQTPITKIVKEKITPKRRLSAWEIVLLVLGFPLWFTLLIAAGAVLFSVYLVLWSVVAVLWTVFAALCLSALACIGAGIVLCCSLHGLLGVAAFGAALVCAGVAVLMFFAALGATKGLVRLTERIFIGKKKENTDKGDA